METQRLYGDLVVKSLDTRHTRDPSKSDEALGSLENDIIESAKTTLSSDQFADQVSQTSLEQISVTTRVVDLTLTEESDDEIIIDVVEETSGEGSGKGLDEIVITTTTASSATTTAPTSTTGTTPATTTATSTAVVTTKTETSTPVSITTTKGRFFVRIKDRPDD